MPYEPSEDLLDHPGLIFLDQTTLASKITLIVLAKPDHPGHQADTFRIRIDYSVLSFLSILLLICAWSFFLKDDNQTPPPIPCSCLFGQ